MGWRVALYDPFLFGVALVLLAGCCLIPLYPKRKGLGRRDYNPGAYYEEGEEAEDAMEKAYREASKGKGRKRYCEIIPRDPSGQLWICQRIRCCNPVNHLLWYRVVYTLALGIVFSMHIKYYFGLFGPGEVGYQTSEQMWAALGFGILGAMMFICCHVLQDIGFGIGAWLTVIIFVLKVWAPDLQLGVTITVLSLTAVTAVAALGFFAFWAFCATTWCLMCCCKDSVGNVIANWFVALHRAVVHAAAFTWCIFVPSYGISHYDTNDQDWLYRCMWTWVICMAVNFAWRFFCCQPEGSTMGKIMECCGCSCCAHCYQSWADPRYHTAALMFTQPSDGGKSRSSNESARPQAPQPIVYAGQPVAYGQNTDHGHAVEVRDEDEEDSDGEQRPMFEIECTTSDQ